MDARHLNRAAWDKQVEDGNPWTLPVESETIVNARRGEWQVFLTPTKPVPAAWLSVVKGKKILCLASGGGQQGPILSAAGAQVTVFDNSPRQLQQDEMVARRDGLVIETVEGTMKDLSVFEDGRFDTIVHPVSNCFVDDVLPVWKEAFRVLRPGGALLSGFNNPDIYLFDLETSAATGKLEAKYSLPYSDLAEMDQRTKMDHMQQGTPFEFSHTLEMLIGGQILAGFVLTGFYEDHDKQGDKALINRHMRPYLATKAVKPAG